MVRDARIIKIAVRSHLRFFFLSTMTTGNTSFFVLSSLIKLLHLTRVNRRVRICLTRLFFSLRAVPVMRFDKRSSNILCYNDALIVIPGTLLLEKFQVSGASQGKSYLHKAIELLEGVK